MDDDGFEEARQIAVRFIDYAPRTRVEVERRLSRGKYDEELIDAVVEDLVRAGLIDDSAFSSQWIESRARSKKLGRARLATELLRKGIDRATVDEALQDLDAEQELEAATIMAQRRFEGQDLSDPATRRRAAAFLQRRGYKWHTVEQVFARIAPNRD